MGELTDHNKKRTTLMSRLNELLVDMETMQNRLRKAEKAYDEAAKTETERLQAIEVEFEERLAKLKAEMEEQYGAERIELEKAVNNARSSVGTAKAEKEKLRKKIVSTKQALWKAMPDVAEEE